MADVAVVAAAFVEVMDDTVDNAPMRHQWTKANGLAFRRRPQRPRAAPLVPPLSTPKRRYPRLGM